MTHVHMCHKNMTHACRINALACESVASVCRAAHGRHAGADVIRSPHGVEPRSAGKHDIDTACAACACFCRSARDGQRYSPSRHTGGPRAGCAIRPLSATAHSHKKPAV